MGLFGPNVSNLHNAGIDGSKLSASIRPEFVLCLAFLACSVSPTKTTAIICNRSLISRTERKARWEKKSPSWQCQWMSSVFALTQGWLCG